LKVLDEYSFFIVVEVVNVNQLVFVIFSLISIVFLVAIWVLVQLLKLLGHFRVYLLTIFVWDFITASVNLLIVTIPLVDSMGQLASFFVFIRVFIVAVLLLLVHLLLQLPNPVFIQTHLLSSLQKLGIDVVKLLLLHLGLHLFNLDDVFIFLLILLVVLAFIFLVLATSFLVKPLKLVVQLAHSVVIVIVSHVEVAWVFLIDDFISILVIFIITFIEDLSTIVVIADVFRLSIQKTTLSVGLLFKIGAIINNINVVWRNHLLVSVLSIAPVHIWDLAIVPVLQIVLDFVVEFNVKLVANVPYYIANSVLAVFSVFVFEIV
jgi:hypothetical protein